MRMTALFLFLWCPVLSFAADSFTRNYVIQASVASLNGQTGSSLFWISSYLQENKPAYFTNASGMTVLANPSSIVSAYDSTSTRYSMSKFYSLNNDHMKLIGHMNGFNKGEIFSIGYDSGTSTQKLSINSALYAGYTKTLSFSKSSITSLSIGSWFGGKIGESPCIDSYGRAYSCQTLTAWSDYKPSYPKPLAFLDLRHVWVFD